MFTTGSFSFLRGICLLLAASFCLLVPSCTSVIQVSVPTGSPLLVVDAFLDNSMQPQKVRLTWNANYFSNVPTPPVLGASVRMNDLTNSKTYTFNPDGNGNYVYTPQIADSMAQLHHQYQLQITYNGNVYMASSTLNRTAFLKSIVFCTGRNPKDTVPTADTTNPRKFYPLVNAIDPPGPVVDYYWLRVYKNGIFYNQPAQIDAFPEAGFLGTDGFPFLPPVAFLGLTPDTNPIYRNDSCTVSICSINKDTYDFLTQVKSQLTNAQSGLFALTPQNVKTNINQISGSQAAVGWFNIGAIVSKSAVAK